MDRQARHKLPSRTYHYGTLVSGADSGPRREKPESAPRLAKATSPSEYDFLAIAHEAIYPDAIFRCPLSCDSASLDRPGVAEAAFRNGEVRHSRELG